MKTTTKAGKTIEKLNWALDRAEDYLGRASIPFLILGKTLQEILEKDQVISEKIELGVKVRHLNSSNASILKMLVPDLKRTKDKLSFSIDGIPVEIKIIRKKFKCLENPDILFYGVNVFHMPNSIEAYRKARYLIR